MAIFCVNVSAVDEATWQPWGQRPGVAWLGASDDMSGVYVQADVVVLPSNLEGLPRILLEASAMGLPSVATDVPGCRNVIETFHFFP